MKKILIFLCLLTFVFTINVNAEELQGVYSSATYNYRLLEYSNVISESVTKDMGDIVNSVPTNAYLDRYIMRVYSDTTSFKTGNTYSFNFYSTLNLDTSGIIGDQSPAAYLRRCYDVSVYANTTSTSQESTTDLVKSKDIIISQDPNSSVRVYVKLIASFHQDVKFVSVLFKHKDICNVYYAGSTTPIVDLKAIGLRTLDITYQQGTDSILNDQNQILQDGFDNINNSINDSNVSESENAYGNFFNGFTTNTHGLTGIITAPLQLIGSITSSTCSDLSLPLPYVNKNLTLPCMSSIYYSFFGNFFIIYQTITFGIISYWVIIRIFNLVKDFKNPEHDEIEVLDL